MYVRSANPGSGFPGTVAGLELTTTVRKPSSRSTLSARQPAQVELAGLADHDGAGADHADRLDVGAPALAAQLLDEALEDRPGVVRPGSLPRGGTARTRAQFGEVEALDGAVVERDVRSSVFSVASTAKPWFWLVTSTRPDARSSTGRFEPR